jgi:hypothetical protein
MAVSLAPTFANAQAMNYAPPAAVGRDGLNGQLDAMAARIDRRLALGHLSSQQAVDAHRQINDLQSEITDDQSRNGGHLSEADRFDLQARIRALKAMIDGTGSHTARPAPGGA